VPLASIAEYVGIARINEGRYGPKIPFIRLEQKHMSNENEVTVSLTECLNANGVMLSSVAAGKVLLVAGVTGVAWRESSKPGRAMKAYKIATPLGESMGALNEAATLPTGDPSHLKFVPGQFASLWASKPVQAALADLLEVGDIKYRNGAASQQSEIF